MINYIIYAGSKNEFNLYKKVIQEFMNDKEDEYMIYKYSDDNHICGKKIYFFDLKKINDFAIIKKIRFYGDWNSQIIASLENKNNNKFDILKIKKLFYFDVIVKDTEWFDKLNLFLKIDYNILNRKKSLCFKYCNELYDILYNDICYIEKNLCNNDSTIVTKNNKYTINLSINKIMNLLNCDYRFYKCHRSCIVNIYNINSYDISNNIIKFDNDSISLVSRDKKKELENKIMERNII